MIHFVGQKKLRMPETPEYFYKIRKFLFKCVTDNKFENFITPLLLNLWSWNSAKMSYLFELCWFIPQTSPFSFQHRNIREMHCDDFDERCAHDDHFWWNDCSPKPLVFYWSSYRSGLNNPQAFFVTQASTTIFAGEKEMIRQYILHDTVPTGSDCQKHCAGTQTILRWLPCWLALLSDWLCKIQTINSCFWKLRFPGSEPVQWYCIVVIVKRKPRFDQQKARHWNCFDFLIVVLSIVSWIAEAASKSSEGMDYTISANVWFRISQTPSPLTVFLYKSSYSDHFRPLSPLRSAPNPSPPHLGGKGLPMSTSYTDLGQYLWS